MFESYAEHLLAFYGSWFIGRVYLYDIIVAFALLLQYMESLWCIVRGYDTIAYLAVDKSGGSFVASVAQCTDCLLYTSDAADEL